MKRLRHVAGTLAAIGVTATLALIGNSNLGLTALLALVSVVSASAFSTTFQAIIAGWRVRAAGLWRRGDYIAAPNGTAGVCEAVDATWVAMRLDDGRLHHEPTASFAGGVTVGRPNPEPQREKESNG